MAKILCVLYDDPVDGYPTAYARDGVPRIERYSGGQTAPTPQAIDFTPGELLGSVSGELGLRRFLEERGPHAGRDLGQGRAGLRLRAGAGRRRRRDLAAVLAGVPDCRSGSPRRPKLKLAITAGIGSDHVDLQAAIEHGVTVAEVTYSNSISVSEHVVMMILSLVRNYIPSHQWVLDGGWNIADCVVAVLRPRRHAGRHGRRRADRLGGAAAAQAVRRGSALHRSASASGGRRARARGDLPPDRGVAGAGLRRGHDQRAAAPGDRAPLQRRADRQDEARRVHREHRARQDLRPGRGRARRWRAASSPGTPATSGSRSRRRPTTRGARCRTTA